jgi:hypothetical protein
MPRCEWPLTNTSILPRKHVFVKIALDQTYKWFVCCRIAFEVLSKLDVYQDWRPIVEPNPKGMR